MKDTEETECKEAEQVDVEEKSKKKKKKKKRKYDNEKDPNTQDIKDEQLNNKQEKSVRQSIDSKNSESGNGIAVNSSSMKGKKKTKCKDAEQSETGESDDRITNSGAMEDKEKIKCKDDEQTDEERSKKKKKRKNQVEYDSCSRGTRDEELGDKQTESFSLKQKEVGKNSGSDHRATNSGAPKDTVKTECKDAGQIEKAEKSEKKKKRKSQVKEDDDDENDSCTRSRDEERSEFRQDTESSDVVNEGIEKTECKNDAKKKKKKRKREECLDEAEGVLNDAGDYCTEGQEGPGKKTKKSKDNGRTENKKSKKSTEKLDLSEEKDEAGDSQWQSADFGDTAQKEKFLRLMGAYKPGNKERSASSSYSVMAMNKQQEKAFSFSLEKQFAQAMQTRKERGTGLGYQ